MSSSLRVRFAYCKGKSDVHTRLRSPFISQCRSDVYTRVLAIHFPIVISCAYAQEVHILIFGIYDIHN